MMKIRIALILPIIVLLLASCRTTKEIPKETIKEVVKVENRTEYVTDTVFFYLPSETDRNTTKDTVSFVETSLAFSYAKYSNGVLFHSINNKDTVIQGRIEKEIVYKDSIVYVEKNKPVLVEKEPGLLQNIQTYGFWVLLLIFVIGIFFFFKR